MTKKITIEISKPLNDGKITKIDLKEPTFKTLKRCGLPLVGGDLDFAKAGPLLEAMAGVPETFLDEMTASDSMKVIAAAMELLGGDDEGK